MQRKLRIGSFATRRMFRSLGCAGAFVVSAFATALAASTATHDPHGLWLREEGKVQFSFYDCDNRLCAKVVAAQDPEDRASIGTVILRGAKQTGPNEWKGKLFNAEDGKTYDGVVTVKSANEMTLKGCLWGVLCSDETWTRISPPLPEHAMATPAQ